MSSYSSYSPSVSSSSLSSPSSSYSSPSSSLSFSSNYHPYKVHKSSPSSSSYSSSTYTPSSSASWWRMKSPSCSPDELTSIIVSPKGCYEVPCDPYNEVFPSIYIGDGTTALCTSLLRSLGVTHVLNAACGKERSLNLINTSSRFYRDSRITFLGIEAYDMPSFYLFPYFKQAADFIDDAIQNHGKVYVHCRMGISRSSTLVLAYLMIKRGFSAQEAVRTVRRHREIIPNDGFLQQLCNLNEELIREKSMQERRDRLKSSYGSKNITAVI